MTLESLEELSFTPRDYQIDAAKKILKSILEDEKRSTILLLPTGMGKTNVAVMVAVELLKKEKITPDGKILFLSPDRKLKHQLHDVCQADLSNYGSSFLLPEGKSLPPKIIQKHFAISRFIFATPELLMNSLFARTPSQVRVQPEDFDKVDNQLDLKIKSLCEDLNLS